MKNTHSLLVAALTIACSFSSVYAQLTCTAPSPDPLFASSGGSMVTLSTGIPYVGIAEYAYGISDKTTIGFMYGQTPGYFSKISLYNFTASSFLPACCKSRAADNV
jgi:hypothetical protein